MVKLLVWGLVFSLVLLQCVQSHPARRSRPTSPVRRSCTEERTYFKSGEKCTVYCFFGKEHDDCVEKDLKDTQQGTSVSHLPNRKEDSIQVDKNTGDRKKFPDED